MAANNYATIAANPVSPKAVRAAVNLKFGPQTHALQNRQKAIPAWYAHYLQTVQQNRDATRQAYAGANQAVANQTTAGAADAAATSQRDLGAAQNDAAARGGTVDPGAALRATQAAGVEKSYADSYGGMLALQGANNQSRFDQLASAGAGDQLVQQNRVRDALSQLRGQRGDYAVQYLQQAAAAQEKAALDAATQSALQSYQSGQLQIGQTNAAASTTRADAALTRAQRPPTPRATKFIDGYSEQDYAQLSPTERVKAHKEWSANGGKSSGKDKYGNTPIAVRSHLNTWNDALAYARSVGAPGISGADLDVGLRTNQHTPADIRDAAVYWATHKAHLTHDLAQQLRALGIRIDPVHVIG